MSASPDPGSSRADAWTRGLVGESYDEIAAAFIAGGVGAPRVVWTPQPADILASQSRFALQYWEDARGEADAPPLAALDPLSLRQALGYLSILEPVADGTDFRYRLFGTQITAISGYDLTGELASRQRASAYVVDFAVASFRAAVLRRQPLLTLRSPVGAQFTASWERLVLPFLDGDGAVARLLSVSVPLTRKDQPVHIVFPGATPLKE